MFSKYVLEDLKNVRKSGGGYKENVNPHLKTWMGLIDREGNLEVGKALYASIISGDLKRNSTVREGKTNEAKRNVEISQRNNKKTFFGKEKLSQKFKTILFSK